MKNIEALLIDFDGTLVDSVPLLHRIYCEFMRGIGCESTRSEFDELNGLSIDDAIEVLKSRHKLPFSSGQILSQYEGLFLELYRTHVRCFEGTVEFVDQLRQGGITVAVVSSSSEKVIRSCLEAQKLPDLVDHIITAEDLPKAKPDPAVYLRALDHLGVEVERALAVEDSYHGASAAVAANIPTVLLTHRQEFAQKWPEQAIPAASWGEVLSKALAFA